MQQCRVQPSDRSPAQGVIEPGTEGVDCYARTGAALDDPVISSSADRPGWPSAAGSATPASGPFGPQNNRIVSIRTLTQKTPKDLHAVLDDITTAHAVCILPCVGCYSRAVCMLTARLRTSPWLVARGEGGSFNARLRCGWSGAQGLIGRAADWYDNVCATPLASREQSVAFLKARRVHGFARRSSGMFRCSCTQACNCAGETTRGIRRGSDRLSPYYSVTIGTNGNWKHNASVPRGFER